MDFSSLNFGPVVHGSVCMGVSNWTTHSKCEIFATIHYFSVKTIADSHRLAAYHSTAMHNIKFLNIKRYFYRLSFDLLASKSPLNGGAKIWVPFENALSF